MAKRTPQLDELDLGSSDPCPYADEMEELDSSKEMLDRAINLRCQPAYDRSIEFEDSFIDDMGQKCTASFTPTMR